jgi:hypothetical protein
MKQQQCAYKELNYYENKCNSCSGEPNVEICYISMEDLKDHLKHWDCIRLDKLDDVSQSRESETVVPTGLDDLDQYISR